MADYDKRYELESAPKTTLDGSKIVKHPIIAQAKAQGNGGWFAIPGRHKDICVPASELQAALASGNPVQAYKNALAVNLNTQPVPITGWSNAQLEALLDANDEAAAAATAADEYITVTLGMNYPVHFSI